VTLKCREKENFLASSMVANAIVIFEVRTLETFVIATNFITQDAPPLNYNEC